MSRTVLILLLPAVTFSACRGNDSAEIVHAESPTGSFEPYAEFPIVAPDAGTAIIRGFHGARLLDLRTGQADSTRFRGAFGAILDARFLPDGGFLRYAIDGQGQRAWWLDAPDGTVRISIPPGQFAVPEVGPRNDRIAFLSFRPGEPMALPRVSFLNATSDSVSTRPLPGRPRGLAWFPDGLRLAMILVDGAHNSSLWEVPLVGEARVIADTVDVPYFFVRLSITPDGTRVLLAMASDHAPDPEERNDPDADRDLDLYAVSVATGAVTRLAGGPHDDFAPSVVSDTLYWMTNATTQRAAVVPWEGGEIRDAFDRDAGITSWHPQGDRIGITYGKWRLVDWALNLDGASIPFPTPEGRTEADVLVQGYHEDFGPVWSPDGRWIAYHSHRSPGPALAYTAGGATDDIYIKSTDGSGDEIRLTDFGLEAGSPDWSPTGDALAFTSRNRDPPGGESAYIVEIAPETGQPRDTHRLPLADSLRVRWVAWSPVSDELALQAQLPDGSAGLYLYARDRATLERIATYEMNTYGGVGWTPDGSHLVYSAIEKGRIALRLITRSGELVRSIRDPESDLLHPRVSPDGQHIAVTRIRHRKEIWKSPLSSRSSPAP